MVFMRSWQIRKAHFGGKMSEYIEMIFLYFALPVLLGVSIQIFGIKIPYLKPLEESLQVLLIVAVFDVCLFLLDMVFFTPIKIFDEQQEIIKSYQINELKLEFKNIKSWFDKSTNAPGLLLLVENQGNKKIIELKATIQRVHKYFLDEREEKILEGFWRSAYNSGENTLEKDSVRPDDVIQGTLISYSEDYKEVKYGNYPIYQEIGSDEAIYKLVVKYKGKVEGELIFKEKEIEVDVYIKPIYKMILLASIASGFNHISQEFREKYDEFIKG